MSRQQLHGIIANLRAYLEWQTVSEPSLGVPAAPPDLQQAFDERKASREAARMEAARASIEGEAPGPASRPQQTPDDTPQRRATPEATAPARAAETSKDDSPRESKPWVKYGPRSRKTFGAKKADQATESKKTEARSQPGTDERPPDDYDGPPLEQPGYDDEDTSDSNPRAFPYPPYGAGNLKEIDPSRFGWHDGKFRSPSEPDNGFSPAQKLAILRMYLGDCTRCGLCEGRTHIVFGDGSPTARLMFVGEGPGYNEDQQAKPFVGKAGELLDKMIGAMGLSREEVYIANVVKCRPPDNRDPAPAEVAACSPFLHKQIAAIQPEVIVTLGRFAAHNLLGVDTPIGKMRGEWHTFKEIPVMPTWHPAYLLRNEDEKGNAWNDLKEVMKRL